MIDLTKEQIANLKAGKGELHGTIQVKRKATGKVEEFRIVGRVAQDPKEHGSSGGMVGEPGKLTN